MAGRERFLAPAFHQGNDFDHCGLTHSLRFDLPVPLLPGARDGLLCLGGQIGAYLFEINSERVTC